MLGTRKPQVSLFHLPFWAEGLVNPDSFYARMGAFWSRVSRDEDLASMYHPKPGKPSVPPSLLCGVLILQYFDDVSDREAAERVRFDLRWKLALSLPLDDRGFHYSTLSRFRSRLAAHGQERYAFDALLRLALQAGLLTRDAHAINGAVIDSTPMHGAAALEDTYTLLRHGLRKLLRAMGEGDPERQRLAKRLKLSRYLTNRKPELDWGDPAARRAHLQELVADAQRLLSEAHEAALPADSEAHGALALLEQILAQDVVQDDDGQHAIRRGVAKDRVISTVDPEMRHGRKSASTRFDGYKGHVAVEPESGLITEVTVTPGNTYDGEAVTELVDGLATHHGLQPQAIVGDHAVIDGARRQALRERGIEAVGKVPEAAPHGFYPKARFHIDLEQGTVTCPAGRVTAVYRERKDARGQVARVFYFDRETCRQCPQRAICTNARGTGRTIQVSPYEHLLQEAREQQKAEGFWERYHRARSTVERVIAHLARHGFRQGRYWGRAKTLFQALWAAAAVNLQRLMALLSDQQAAQTAAEAA